MAATDPQKQLAALYEAEYGDLTDIVARTLGITLGGLLLYLYTGWAASWAWGVIFAAVHLVQWRFLRRDHATATNRDAAIGGALFVLVHVAFIWLPTRLAANADPALMLAGMLVFVVTAMYHIRRADTVLWLVLAQIGVFTLSLVCISTQHLLRIDDTIARLAIAMVTAMAIVYIALVMLGMRRKQMQILAAAHRLAQEQKLTAIGRLAGGVAHDFNNILTVIKGNLELYEQLDSPAERAAALEDTHRAAERAEGVIQKLLVYAGKAPSNPERLDIRTVIEDAAALARGMVAEGVRVTSHTDPAPLPVKLDEKHLMAALLDLIGNAGDAMPGRGEIALSTRAVDLAQGPELVSGRSLPPGRYAEIRVRDTGTGIPRDVLPRVADPFFTTKPPGQGTGLGLSMVSGFVDAVSGGMVITSEARGTEVTLLVPLTPAASAPDGEDAPPAP